MDEHKEITYFSLKHKHCKTSFKHKLAKVNCQLSENIPYKNELLMHF